MKDLTRREAEILSLLKNDPMISQEDLADRLQISRSAAAVHISNLIKKGSILGRGYVFNERMGIMVCGAVYFRTIGRREQGAGKGLSLEKITDGTLSHGIISDGTTSNGTVFEDIGGISFEVACRLAEYHPVVRFISAVGRDEKGERVVSLLNKAGVETAQMIRSSAWSTAHGLEMFDSDGKKQSHMDGRILEILFRQSLVSRLEPLKTSELLVLDGFTASCLGKAGLSEINQTGSQTLVILDGDFSCQAELVSGDNLFYLTVEEKQEQFSHRGTANIIVMRPRQGVRLFVRNHEEEISCLPGQQKDFGWSFPAFSAGFISGIYKHLSLRQAARLGMSYSAKEGMANREQCQ